jgi:tetratricopeptide (TPR) repeat protein
LAADFDELNRQLGRRQTVRTQRRLCRLIAEMAGLTSLVLTKLEAYDEAKRWTRTARLAASEAGNRTVRSWVEAQEAYADFYSGGSPWNAIKSARSAQEITKSPSVGGALAAALEARAYAVLNDSPRARASLDRATKTLDALPDELRGASAFGYNEAQLRFHEGNVLLLLGDVDGAWVAQKRALSLYPVNDGDRILVHMDRAIGLAKTGYALESLEYAADALSDTPVEQRIGIASARSRILIANLAAGGRMPPSLRSPMRAVLELTEQEDTK